MASVGSMSSLARSAAARAASSEWATTMASGWPACSTLSSANSGSSLPGLAMLLRPGMSPAANTATTPGDDAAIDRSSFFRRPLAIGLSTSAACSVPGGSAMSSI